MMRLASPVVSTRHLSCSPVLQSECSFELVQKLGTLLYADFLNVHQFPLNRRKFLNAFDAHHAPIWLSCFQLSVATCGIALSTSSACLKYGLSFKSAFQARSARRPYPVR